MDSAINPLGASTVFVSKQDSLVWFRIAVPSRLAEVEQALRLNPGFLNLLPVTGLEKVPARLRSEVASSDSLKLSLATVGNYRWTELAASWSGVECLKPEAACTGEATSNRWIVHATLAGLEILATDYWVETVTPQREAALTNPLARELVGLDQLQPELESYMAAQTGPLQQGWYTGIPYTGAGVTMDFGENFCAHPSLMETDGAGNPVQRSFRAGEVWGECGTAAGPVYSAKHATGVASVAAGNGAGSRRWGSRWGGVADHEFYGVAPAVKISNSSEIHLQDADISSRSIMPESNAFYSEGDALYDMATASHTPDAPIVIGGAGNQGYGAEHSGPLAFTFSCNSGRSDYAPQGYYSMLFNSKNAVKVCNSASDAPIRYYASSMGPTRDGRIGPDICAPGSGSTHRQVWNIEFDEIEWVNNNTIKAHWDFAQGSEGWNSAWGPQQISAANGKLIVSGVTAAVGTHGPIMSPKPPSAGALPIGMRADHGDKLRFRWKATPVGTLVGASAIDVIVRWTKMTGPAPLSEGFVRSWTPVQLGQWQTVEINLDGDWENGMGDYEYNTIGGGGWPAYIQQNPWPIITGIGLELGSASYDGYVMAHAGSGGYWAGSGTSESAPHVAGVVALMLEKYKKESLPASAPLHENRPWNSTIRALLIHTATDMLPEGETPYWELNGIFNLETGTRPLVTEGPDFATGYGLLNAKKAVDYMVPEAHWRQDVVGVGKERQFILDTRHQVSQGGKSRVTLVWDDPEATYSGADVVTPRLVNDLDIVAVNIATGELLYPWALDGTKLGVASECYPGDPGGAGGIEPLTLANLEANKASRGADNNNNVEVLDLPDGAVYRIRVLGQGITRGPQQDFSLVYDYPLQEAYGDVLGFQDANAWNPLGTAPFQVVDKPWATWDRSLLAIPAPGVYTSQQLTTVVPLENLLPGDATQGAITVEITRIAAAPRAGYYGNLQFFYIPAGANTGTGPGYIGQVELTDLGFTPATGRRMGFAIPTALLSLFKGTTGVKLGLMLSVNSIWSTDRLYIDDIRFEETFPQAQSGILCNEPPLGIPYWSAGVFHAGDRVQYAREVYECLAGPTSPWCQSYGYEPGAFYWTQAWKKVGRCIGVVVN